MLRETFPVGVLQCNCSILADEVTREAIVVDPGDEIERIVAWVTAKQLKVTKIVVTHAHIDHIAGAQKLKSVTGAPILYNQLDLPLVTLMDVQAGWLGMATPDVQPPDEDLADGLKVRFGSHVAEALFTPGHTQGSTCLHLASESLLLAGDTLFAGTVGRTDLPGGNARLLIASIHDRLLTLPDATVVVAGHGQSTLIGTERERNPFLQP